MAKKGKKAKISVAELQAWISGIEDMQPSEWAPNLEQWKLIRAKIMALDPDLTSADQKINQITGPGIGKPSSNVQTHRPRPTTVFTPPPPVPGGVPPVPVEMTDAARRAMSGQLPNETLPPGLVPQKPPGSFI